MSGSRFDKASVIKGDPVQRRPSLVKRDRCVHRLQTGFRQRQNRDWLAGRSEFCDGRVQPGQRIVESSSPGHALVADDEAAPVGERIERESERIDLFGGEIVAEAGDVVAEFAGDEFVDVADLAFEVGERLLDGVPQIDGD